MEGTDKVVAMDHGLITDNEFKDLSALVYKESGISLNSSKKPLLVSRLSRRLRALGLGSFRDYYQHIEAHGGDEEIAFMIDLVSTNKTDFFREPAHFDFLREEILPALQTKRQVRIWSSACSSGEEPYSIAMTLFDGVAVPSAWNFRVLASDISTRVLAKAETGLFSADRVSDLPDDLVRRHFLKGRGENEGKVKIKKHLSGMITFRRINLMDDRYPIKQPLDLIFCRNVMIYFDRPTQERLMQKFYSYLKPGGFLFIGHSESLQWIKNPFKYTLPTIYRREA